MDMITWYAPHNNGVFQKKSDMGLWSDLLTAKPVFSFKYESFNYVVDANRFDVDGEPMTDAQKAEVAAYLNAQTPPIEWVKHVINGKITAEYNSSTNQDTAGKPEFEVATFKTQYEEAKKVLADNSTASVYLETLVDSRGLGETVIELAEEVVSKYEAMILRQAVALGLYQSKRKQLAAATTVEACKAII
jgi:hypothetical protein